jgi:hypothetical protein
MYLSIRRNVMKTWIPLVLEQNLDAVYSECRCPKCGFESVHHMGVPCQHYSCPKCGEVMQRLEEPEEVKESIKFYYKKGVTRLAIQKKKKYLKEPEEVKEGIVTKTKSGVFKLPDGSGFFTATIGTKKKKKNLKESELIEAYLTYVQNSELQEVNWKGVKDYFTKERPQPPWVQKRIAAAKVGDAAFAQKVTDKVRQQRLAQIKTASTQKPLVGAPVRVGT